MADENNTAKDGELAKKLEEESKSKQVEESGTNQNKQAEGIGSKDKAAESGKEHGETTKSDREGNAEKLKGENLKNNSSDVGTTDRKSVVETGVVEDDTTIALLAKNIDEALRAKQATDYWEVSFSKKLIIVVGGVVFVLMPLLLLWGSGG